MSGVSFTEENIWHAVSWFHVLLKLRVFDNEHTHRRETVITQWCAALNLMIAAFGEPTVSGCEPCACFEYNDACVMFSFAREHDECYTRFARAARCVATRVVIQNVLDGERHMPRHVFSDPTRSPPYL